MSDSVKEKDLENVTGGTEGEQEIPVSNCTNDFWNPCAYCPCLKSRTNLETLNTKCPTVIVSCSQNRFRETNVILDTFLGITQRSKGPRRP